MNEAGSAVGFNWRDPRSAVMECTGWGSDSTLKAVTLEDVDEIFVIGP